MQAEDHPALLKADMPPALIAAEGEWGEMLLDIFRFMLDEGWGERVGRGLPKWRLQRQ